MRIERQARLAIRHLGKMHRIFPCHLVYRKKSSRWANLSASAVERRSRRLRSLTPRISSEATRSAHADLCSGQRLGWASNQTDRCCDAQAAHIEPLRHTGRGLACDPTQESGLSRNSSRLTACERWSRPIAWRNKVCRICIAPAINRRCRLHPHIEQKLPSHEAPKRWQGPNHRS